MEIDFHDEMMALICQAALDPADWSRVLDRLSRQFGGMRNHLVSYDMLSQRATPNVVAGFDPDFAQMYDDHYQFTNPWAPQWAASEVEVFLSSYDIPKQDDLESTAFFHDWVRPQENMQAGGGIVLVREATRAFMLGGNLPLAEMDRSQAGFAAALNRLAPLLRHAIEVNRMLSGARLDALALRAGMEPRATAIMVLAADGTLLNCNRLAADWVSPGGVVAVDGPGRLRLGPGRNHDRLTTCLAPSLRGMLARAAAFELTEGTTTRPCRLVPVPQDQGASLSLGLLRREPAVAVLMIGPTAETPGPDARLARRFGPSPAEADVALLLHAGLTPNEIAARRQVSLFTVRNQIKSALSKSDSRRQADLTRRIERLLRGARKR